MKRKFSVKFEYESDGIKLCGRAVVMAEGVIQAGNEVRNLMPSAEVTYISNLGFIDGKDYIYTDSTELRLQP